MEAEERSRKQERMATGLLESDEVKIKRSVVKIGGFKFDGSFIKWIFIEVYYVGTHENAPY